MNIRVQVMSAQAQAQIKALQAQVAALQKQAMVTGGGIGAIGGAAGLAGIRKLGMQMQWAGRMLQYNFTIPLLLAGGAATKFALDQEKAMTRVAKVYGDTSAAIDYYVRQGLTRAQARQRVLNAETGVFAQELEALEKAFIAMSNRYGVAASEVMEVAGAWAAAGASGEDLARSVDTTMRAMILGELEHAEASEALIAIQAQYNLSSKELYATLTQLNAIENQTGIQTKGLIQGFSRAAAVAREAGVDTRHLGAMLAALVPATGSASQAGNALKTIISRVLAPTREASQIINEMGFEIQSVGWQSATASERIQMLADQWQSMNGAARATASAYIASRWQITKFEQLMEELSRTNGYYQKALDATSSQQQAFKTATRELNAVLESSPARLEQIWRSIQNGMATAVAPMIPYLIWMAQSVADAVRAFQGLPPEVQKLILVSALALALLGPLLRYLGALKVVVWAAMVTIGKGSALAIGALKLLWFTASTVFTTLGAAAWASASAVFSAFSMLPSLGVIFSSLASAALASFVFIGKAAIAIPATIHGVMGVLVPLMVSWIPTVTAAWTAAIGTLTLMWGALATGIQFWLTVAAGRIIQFGAASYGITGAIIGGLKSLWFAWGTAWIAITGTFSAGVQAAYATGYVKLAGITAAFGATMSGLWTAMYTRLITIQLAATGLMSRIWVAFAGAGGVIGIAKKMWAGLVALWVLGGTLLNKATLKMVLTNIKWFTLLYRWPIILLTALLGVVYRFRDQIGSAWDSIVSWFVGSSNAGIQAVIDGWHAMPQGIANALQAVVRIISTAAQQVYEWMSYLNPFAKHSPSLVDNVKNGMATVAMHFRGGAEESKKALAGVYPAIQAFENAIKKLIGAAGSLERVADRKAIKKFAPGALAEWDALAAKLRQLEPLAAAMQARIKGQEVVVARWEKKLDKANQKLDEQRDKLERLQAVADKWQGKLSEAQDELDRYASAPLKGMREMEEQIWQNQWAQTQLRYEIMKMEEAYGTFDDLKQKIEGVNAAQELMRGTQENLRAAGAGSEILGQYDEELKKLDEQKSSYSAAADQLGVMYAQMQKLQQEAEKLDLTKAMKFDQLQHEIDMAVNQVQEMSFDEIIAGIRGAQADVAKYTDKLADANAAVADQQKIVNDAEKDRDRIQRRLDQENETLDRMKERYDAINQAIQDINETMSASVEAARAMQAELDKKKDAKKKKKGPEEYVTPGLQNFRDAMKYGGEFPDVGGAGSMIRKDWSSQVDGINKITDDLVKETADMFGGLNPFGPIKDYWNKFKDWATPKWEAFKTWAQDTFGKIWDGLSGEGARDIIDSVRDTLEPFTTLIKDIVDTAIKWGSRLWDLFGPEVKKTFRAIVKAGEELWDKLGPVLADFGELFGPMGEALQNVWTIMKPILAVMSLGFLLIGKVIWSILNEVVGPVFSGIIDVITGAVKIIQGIIKIFIGIFTGDFKMMGDGILQIFEGLWQGIWGIVKNLGKIIWGVVEGFVKGVVGFFQWLYDVIFGHSIVPDLIDGIISTFEKLGDLPQWVWDNLLKPIWDFFVDAYNDVMDQVDDWWGGLKDGWKNIKDNVKSWWKDNIWEPVRNGITEWWTNRKSDFTGWWGDLKDKWNNITSNIKTWWLNNIWDPVKNGITEWWGNRKAAFAEWWGDLKEKWNNISSNIRSWWFNNIWDPVRAGVVEWWGNRITQFAGWWEALKGAWSNIKTNIGTWWENNVTDPIFDKVTGVWTRISNWFNNNPNILKDAVKGVVNAGIRAINSMITGLNKVADVLPGLSFHIDPIPTLAQGGIPNRRVGSGFMTSGARAIVGEGKANYPEFVIPTDPTYRSRARSLLASAADRLGVVTSGIRNRTGGEAKDLTNVAANGKSRGNWIGTPLYAMGGILGAIKDKIGDIGSGAMDWVVNNGQDMVSFLAGPFLKIARGKVNELDWNLLRAAGHYGLDKVSEWIGAGDKAYNQGYDDATGGPQVRKALSWAKSQAGKPYVWGGVGPSGYDCSGFMSAITNVMRGSSPYSRVGATSTFPWGGFVGGAMPKGFTIGSARNYGSTGIGHMAGTLGGVNVESRGGDGVVVGAAARGYMDGGFNRVAHLNMKYGALVRKRTGGTTFMATMGEAGSDEAIVPLPANWKGGLGGEKNFYFYGDLEFPNITDPEDADLFIQNLENMARD
jgi:TP901 family phage tail tape measure protein